MKAVDFFSAHPVFTHAEFLSAHSGGGRRSRQTSNNLLSLHLATGRILRVRRGIYAAASPDVAADCIRVDPWLVASKLTDDAVLAYHTALQFHGKAHSLWRRFPFLTSRRMRPFRFRDLEFVPVQIPAALRRQPDMGGGIVESRYNGEVVRITTLERTMVDVLDRPEHGGGWEEIWRSLESVGFFDLDAVASHVLRRESALTVARVGLFLDRHREEFMVAEDHLRPLRERIPKQPRYFDRNLRGKGKLVSEWQLIVPEFLLERAFAEVP